MASTLGRRSILRPLLAYRLPRRYVAQSFSTTAAPKHEVEPRTGLSEEATNENDIETEKKAATDLELQRAELSPQSPWKELGKVFSATKLSSRKEALDDFSFAALSALKPSKKVYMKGFLVSKRIISRKLAFAALNRRFQNDHGDSDDIPLVFSGEAAVKMLKNTRLYSPVGIFGTVQEAQVPADKKDKNDKKDEKDEKDEKALEPKVPSMELAVISLRCFNQAPARPMTDLDNFPLQERVLQLRFHRALSLRLIFRESLEYWFIQMARKAGFMSIRTPTLVRSTPEGAREFLVPTRNRGSAYALAQSPQQFKQALMATGHRRYMQFATCWRDEDLRQDRQPEFTQLDLEMAFTDSATMRKTIAGILKKVWLRMANDYNLARLDAQDKTYVPVLAKPKPSVSRLSNSTSSELDGSRYEYGPGPPAGERGIDCLTYDQAMRRYGSDKPDLRIPGKIMDVTRLVSEPFKRMITTLEDDPVVEAWKIDLGTDPRSARRWATSCMEQLDKRYTQNPHGAPAILVYDPSQPLDGFSSLGVDGLPRMYQNEAIPTSDEFPSFAVVFQARPRPDPQVAYQGASTRLGELRKLVFEHAVAAGHVQVPAPNDFRFVWVSEHPMFRPKEEGDDPRQSSESGISATHHPFTSPLSSKEWDLLEDSPLLALADSYDLVLNGVEVGGGSVRIHRPELQEAVMRRVLGMNDERVEQFRPLLNALQFAPPHCGFAFGFDRLVALLSATNSIRDVIAFPKTMKGEDAWAKSPAVLTEEQLATYHLKLREA